MKKNQPWWVLTPIALSLSLFGCGGSDNNGPVTVTPPITVTPPVAVDNSCLTTNPGTTPVVVGSGVPGDPAAPEPASGYVLGHKLVTAKSYMVVANHPLATKAGCDVLKAGGSAADAAIAVQAVLALVEPQSSSLAGGAFMLYYDVKTNKVQAYDGRETAPAAATADYLRYIDASNQTVPKPNARGSGRSIGTPGVMRMLEMAHGDHGKLAWKDLFGEGTRLATDGFKIGGRMAAAIEGSKDALKRDAEATAYFFDAAGAPKPLGATLTNPPYAAVLKAMASQGADALYTGKIAEDIVAKIGITQAVDGSPITPGLTTLDDLKNYRPKRRDPVCTTYRAYYICSMSPPSSGGIGVLSALGILENFNLDLYKPTNVDLEGGKPTVMGVHLVTEAERLAYADRDKYVADTDFVPLPGGSANTLLNKDYMRLRADLIRTTKTMGVAPAGDFGLPPIGVDTTVEHGTTHFSIVDKEGNVVTMTTTVEGSMGSFHMSHGILLNNQLTDFNASPTDSTGALVPNRVAPGKRPRSTMAPTMVFRGSGPGDFVMATGSPGGGTIIQYVVKTVVGALDWGLDAQQATSLVDFGASNSNPPSTSVGREHPNIVKTPLGNGTDDAGANDPLVLGLKALGHNVSTSAQSSGISTIIRVKNNTGSVLTGGADPRREGIVLGDVVTP
ncbi:gamma-glutamyltransferase family protein [Variovorax sp. UMC13]|uniref:gamma-glutamyltransferase family protein n=1 Tax=Variovorax sp. UMC13 TaxID=1862326 RepID=UPI0016005293|nr:gamma-glutamyltransferase family protein [Variovorax sp. UMC13]MBB1599540.1 gamma-glutamyltransferase [Variovorax sp. UMC13]